jgi:hypothetical protein
MLPSQPIAFLQLSAGSLPHHATRNQSAASAEQQVVCAGMYISFYTASHPPYNAAVHILIMPCVHLVPLPQQEEAASTSRRRAGS